MILDIRQRWCPKHNKHVKSGELPWYIICDTTFCLLLPIQPSPDVPVLQTDAVTCTRCSSWSIYWSSTSCFNASSSPCGTSTAPQHEAPPNSASEFVKSKRGKPKLIHAGYTYIYHKYRSNEYIAWRCELTSKVSRDKGINCNATAVTTGVSSSSTLVYARPHSHPPLPGRFAAYKVYNKVKAGASRDITAKPHLIVTDSISNLSDEVHLNLPDQRSLKRIIQRTDGQKCRGFPSHLQLLVFYTNILRNGSYSILYKAIESDKEYYGKDCEGRDFPSGY